MDRNLLVPRNQTKKRYLVKNKTNRLTEKLESVQCWRELNQKKYTICPYKYDHVDRRHSYF